MASISLWGISTCWLVNGSKMPSRRCASLSSGLKEREVWVEGDDEGYEGFMSNNDEEILGP